ncbi:MAG: alpha/beta hydrolase fold protein [Nocardioides sp.]|nr:alpha/beta hydrolase fold protein [Nocardioides sp.]
MITGMTTVPEPGPDHAALTIDARPELTGGRRIGVLLSHGFTGSPVSIRPWGEALGALGHGVAVPRLPGHGTTWQDLNTHRFDDWYGEVARTFDRLCLDHDAVVVGGLSMGGALALKLAEDHPDRVSGLVLVNPAVSTQRLDVKLLPVLKHVVPSFPGIANDIKKPGVLEGGYTRTPLKAIHSFMQAWPTLRADLPKVTCPVLLFRSTDDHVVDEGSRRLILDGISSSDVEDVTLHESFHVATLDNDAPAIFARTAEFVGRVTAD